MKISQKEFTRAMVENLTDFVGNVRKLYTSDEVYCMLAQHVERVRDGVAIVGMRSATAHGDYVEFSGGSRVDVKRAQCHKYEYPTFDVYVNGAVAKGDSEPWMYMYYVVIR